MQPKLKTVSYVGLKIRKNLFLLIFIFSLSLFFANTNLFAANTIDGYCYLDGETNHTGTKVMFAAVSPSAVTDSSFTDSDGYFSTDLESGIYNIIYSHANRVALTIGDTFLTNDATLAPVTLYYELNGSLSDTLFSTYEYHVSGDIFVNSEDSLLIEAGTSINFLGDYTFTINGKLTAAATYTDSILFTYIESNPNAGDWSGIKFEDNADPGSIISYARIEYADIAITCDGTSLLIRNNQILSGNTGIECINSASPDIYNNTICNSFFSGISCSSNSEPDIKNNIFYNNGTGIEAQSSPFTLEYNLFWQNSTNGSGSSLPSYFGQLITVNANGDSCDTYFNIFTDPQFVNSVNDDYHLASTSPAIDAGDPDFPYNPDSTIADIGAYYHYQSNIRGTVYLNGGSGDITAVEVIADTVTVNPNPNGEYQITIPAGTYEVSATLPDYQDTTIYDVEVMENQSTSEVNITLVPIPGSISGMVSLSNRVGDITEVEVTAGGNTVNPDTSGYYTISPLFPGNYSVTASLPDYADSTVTGVTVTENQNTPNIDFTLVALPGIIQGNVNLSGGTESVTNIAVSAGAVTVNPDTTGDYSLSIQPGTYDVVASHANYVDSTIFDVEVIENSTTSDVNFTLDPLPGSISGTVTLSNRVGDITEVEITTDTITVHPDSSGYYSISSLSPDSYDLTASLANYQDSTRMDVQVVENQNTSEVDFTLIALPGTIQGNVTVADTVQDLTEVEVTAGDVTSNPDTFGNYSLSIQPGTYDVTASLTDYADSTLTDVVVIENADTTGIDFMLEPLPGEITGTVSLANRVGNITDVEVSAGGITVNPDTNGVYSITIEEGTYDVVASLTNYEDSTITDVEALKNQTTSGIDFTLQPLPGSISGTVSLANRLGNITEVEITAGDVTVNPDSTGNYSMTIAPGTYDVSASLANYVDSTITDVVVLENQSTTDVNFTLIAMPGTISGTVSLATRDWTITEAEVTAGGVTVNPDSTGAYSLGLQPGTYDVNASLTNYMDTTVSDVQVIENQDTTGVDFTMEAAYGSIEGVVTLIGGTGDVVDVEITAGGQTTNPDDSGYYVINNLLPGFYDVSAALNGYPTGHVQDVEVQLLQITPNIDFTLISGPPDVDFTAVPDSGCAPIEVQFTDESTAQPTSWLWQFGDGTTSTEQNPTHLYSEPSTYTVSLTATNSTGSSTLIRDDLIKAGEPPTADFGASPTAGTAPLGVSFINQSVQVSGFPTTWQWDFGDGGTSNSQSPGHVYQEAGIYSVELIASNDCGVDTLNRTDYITVYSGPMADFGATPLNGCQPLTVNFTDSSANIPTSWQWDFGDGATTTAQNPNHEYDEWGIFTVSLTVSNPAG
ncbi:MAG: carboxypeptidase regulatory-like domain-containing protein, partial [Candidatus Cloacimonetes bacterium]|nr:carboxypeptidase regulatory-like domain-containing protein [Candidatus Cloacimonadota bacterium]